MNFQSLNLPLISELDILLMTLLFIAIILLLILTYKIKSLQNKCNSALLQNEADSKILYLQSKYASMGETVGNIAHQWKQPLNAIGSIQNNIKAALIFQGEISKEKLLNSVETSFKLLQHLAETIDTFYSFLSQRNNQKMNFTIADELEAVRKITEYSFENSRITLNFQLDTNPTIQGNPNEFTHAILNLILNAKDAFDAAPNDAATITVHVKGGEKNCTITVTDNAGGIRLKPIEMVFDLHITTKESGSGLGLFMSKNIIQNRFGGTIAVKNLKEGACFTIELPYSKYGEHFSDTEYLNKPSDLDHIKQLTKKILELEELEKTLKKFAINHIQEAIFLINENSRFEYVNDEACRSLGYSRAELLTMSLEDIDSDWPTDEWHIQWKKIQREKIPPIEAKHIRKDGSTFPVEVSINYFEHEGIGYNLTLCRNITERRLLEEQKDNERMRLFFERQLVGMAITSPEKGWINTNEKLQQMLGYTHEELTKRTWVEMTHPDDLAPDIEQFERLLSGCIEDYMLEKRFIRKDGSIVYTNLAVSCVRNDDRSVNYVLALLEDITERKAMEISIQEANERYTQILNNSIDVIYLIEVTPDWHFIYMDVNAAYVEVTGIPREAVIGLNVEEIEDEIFRTILIDKFTTCLHAGGETDYIADYPFPGGIRTFHSVLSPIRDENGRIVRIVGAARDITERKQIENKLKRSESSLKEAQKIARVGSWELDVASDTLTWSDETYRIFELDRKQTIELHKTFYEMVHPDDREMVNSLYMESVKTKLPYEVSHRIVMSDGRIKYVVERCETHYDINGNPIRSMGTVHDITERRLMEKEIEDSYHFLYQLIDSIPDPIFVKDKQHTWVLLNKAFCELIGQSRESLLGKSDYDFFPKEQADIFWEKDEIVFKSNETNVNEEYFTSADGTTHYIQTIKTMFTSDSKGEHLVGTIRDMTERKQAEETIKNLNATLEKRIMERTEELQKAILELQEREEKFYNLFKLSPAAVSITSLERNMYLEVNDSFLYHTGYTREEVVGHSSAELKLFANPEDRAEFFRLVMENGMIRDFEYPFQAKDAHIGYAMAYASIITLKGERCLLSHSYDISERKKIEILQYERLMLEERLSKIAASMPGVTYIFEKTVDGIIRFNYVAPTFEELFGLSADVAMENFAVAMEHVYPDDREKIHQSIILITQDISNWHEEFRILHPDKGVIWIEGQSSPELQSDGSILWYGFFHDATERKDAEAALEKSEEAFRAMVENSPDVIIRYDLECRRTYINPMGQLLMGKPLEEIIGKTPSEYSPLPASTAFEKLFANVVSEGKEIEMESTYYTSEGEERWGHQRIVPEFNTEGQVASVMVIGRDMTERKHTEKQLKLVETAINHASDAVYIIGDDRSILYVSDAACRMLGYTREEFMGMRVYEIDAGMSKDDIDAVKENIITDKEITFETKHRAKDGYILDVEITVTSFTYDDVHLRLSIVKDISERKQAQLALQASEQRYKEIFENSSDSIYLMEVTEDGRFRTIAANPAFEHSIGIPLDTLLGTYVGDLTDEETTATVIAKYRRCVEAAEPIEEIAELDLPVGRKKFCSTLIPIKDETGRVCRIIGLAKDITEAIK